MPGFGTETFLFRGDSGLTNLGSSGTAAIVGSVTTGLDAGQTGFLFSGGWINVTGITHGGAFSLGAWIRRTTAITTAVIIERDAYGTTKEFGMVQSGVPSNGVSSESNNSFVYDNASLSTTWELVVMTLSVLGSLVTYRNGVAIKTGTLSLPISNSDPIRIGSRNGTFVWSGWMDDIRFESGGVWSAAQIAAWFAAGRRDVQQSKNRRRVAQSSIRSTF